MTSSIAKLFSSRRKKAASEQKRKSNRFTPKLGSGGIRIEHSKLFWFQALAVWLVLCLPGNIFTLVLYHKTSQKTTSNYPEVEQTNNSSNTAHQLPGTKVVLDNNSMSNLTTGKNGTNFSRVENF